MKTSILAVVLATAGFAAAPLASHATEAGNGFFINGNIGQSNLDKGVYDDDDTGYGLNVGYRWALSPNFALGVEGGYSYLGKFEPKSSEVAALPSGEFLRRAELKGWTLGGNARLNVADNWYLSGRAGLFRADATGDVLDAAGLPVSADNTSTKWYAGAGVGYDFANNVSVGINYDYYKADKNGLNLNPNLVSVSAEYRF